MTLNSVSCDLIFQDLGTVIYIQEDFIPPNNSSKIAVDLDRFIYSYFNLQTVKENFLAVLIHLHCHCNKLPCSPL